MGQSLAIPNIIPGDWKRADLIVRKIKLHLGSTSSPTFTGLTISGLTASRLTATDSAKALESVEDLTAWVAGTTNQITVTDDSDGTITLSTPQDIHTGASPTFVGLTLSGLTASRLTSSSGAKALTSVGDLTAWIAGTTDHISVADDSDGTVTLDLDTNTRTLLGSFNGMFLEKLDFTISEAGGTVTGSLEQDSGGDLIQRFSDGYTTLDCTPALTINLTGYVGSNAVPKEVFVYILQSAKTVMAASNSDWPSTEHIKIAHLVLKSAATTGTDGGALVNQNVNDFASAANGEGHISHVEERIRKEPARWDSGTALTLKNSAGAALTTTNSSTAVEIVVATGQVYQLHRHAFPAFDMYDTATDDAHVVNQPTDEGGAYETTVDLVSDVTHYVDGTAAGVAIGTNKYFNLVIWGIQNRGGEASHIMINLPTSQYTTEAHAISDTDGTSVFDIPSAFEGTGFLIARLTFRLIGGAQWTYIAQEDLRGKQAPIAAGVSVSVTAHDLLAHLAFTDAGHTGFLASDGSVALGGAWDLGGNDLNNGGVIFLTEQAAAEADVAGKGQLWVKTATPNELYFVDDAGTEFQLGLGGGQVKIDAAATQAYIGAAGSDGVLRVATGISYTDGGDFITIGGFTSKCSVKLSGAQAITTATQTKIEFDSVNYDIDNEWDETTNYRFTATTTGYYAVSCAISFQALDDTDAAIVIIDVNGVNTVQVNVYAAKNAGSPGIGYAKDLYLEANDYVEFIGYHDYGSNRNANATIFTFATIHRFA